MGYLEDEVPVIPTPVSPAKESFDTQIVRVMQEARAEALKQAREAYFSMDPRAVQMDQGRLFSIAEAFYGFIVGKKG